MGMSVSMSLLGGCGGSAFSSSSTSAMISSRVLSCAKPVFKRKHIPCVACFSSAFHYYYYYDDDCYDYCDYCDYCYSTTATATITCNLPLTTTSITATYHLPRTTTATTTTDCCCCY